MLPQRLLVEGMPTTFKAAGILFTDGVHVLAGFQPGKAAISGFGGSREGSETIRQTAFREALEELLEPASIPISLLQSLVTHYKEYPITRKGTYRFLTLSFEDLLLILKEAKDLKSQIYKSIPTTMAALLKKRTPTSSSEVTTLMLLPVTDLSGIDLSGMDLDPHFAEDLLSI
jgi:hypothetical protein